MARGDGGGGCERGTLREVGGQIGSCLLGLVFYCGRSFDRDRIGCDLILASGWQRDVSDLSFEDGPDWGLSMGEFFEYRLWGLEGGLVSVWVKGL